MEVERDLDSEAVRVPDHVVYRVFAKETVVLNLQTGSYHGLNQTAGRMLEVMSRSGTVGEAADSLAVEYGVPREEVAEDLYGLCRQLLERGLIQLEAQ